MCSRAAIVVATCTHDWPQSRSTNSPTSKTPYARKADLGPCNLKNLATLPSCVTDNRTHRNLTRRQQSPAEYAEDISRRYATEAPPWDSGRPSTELVRVIEAGRFPGATVLEMGCGTGTNAVELARRGYRVTAVDLVASAVEKGRAKASSAGVTVDFRVGDLTQVELGGPYDCLFDSGLYHGIRDRDLAGFCEALRRVSRRGTLWLSLAGNAREITPDGPPVVTEAEFRNELGPLFRIVEVNEFRFDLRPDFRPLAWSILMERR